MGQVFNLPMQDGILPHQPPATVPPPMDGIDALRVLAAHRTDEVVFTHMSCIHDWALVSGRPDRDVAITRPMGKCADIALGLALARPDQEFWVLDGDGSLLMNLGCLVTIGHAAPANLVHFVYRNDTYDTTGGQPVPGAGTADFAAIALGCGYATAAELCSLEALEQSLPMLLAGPRPSLISLRVAPTSARPYPDPSGTGRQLEALRAALLSFRP